MDIEGKLIQKLAVQSGASARGEWAKQEFVVEYQDGSFPTRACFNVWGADKVRELENFQPGDYLKVSFNVSSREYNGRWYTDLRAWRVSVAGGQGGAGGQQAAYGQAPAGQGQSPYASQDMPAGFAPSYGNAPSALPPEAPAPASDDMPSDDLPF